MNKMKDFPETTSDVPKYLARRMKVLKHMRDEQGMDVQWNTQAFFRGPHIEVYGQITVLMDLLRSTIDEGASSNRLSSRRERWNELPAIGI